MLSQSSIILTYKSKILLFSKDILIQDMMNKNEWSFAEINKIKELKLNGLEMTQLDNLLFYVKLTDDNVNGMNRENGYRIEFYRFAELDKLSLTDKASRIVTEHRDKIKALLTS